MIDVSAGLVVEQMTYVAVVAAHAAATGAASCCYWLPCVAEHADHLLDCISVQAMVAGIIMT